MPDVIYNNTSDIEFYNSSDIWWFRNIPEVDTLAVSAIETNSFQGNGSLEELGGENSTERGFCFIQNTSGDPSVLDDYVSDEGSFGLGNFNKMISSLTMGKNYRVRAFATNSAGIGYGETVTTITSLLFEEKIDYEDARGKALGKAIAGLVAFLEERNRKVEKVLDDILEIRGQYYKEVGLQKLDLLTVADSIFNSIEKFEEDSLSIEDSIQKSVDLIEEDDLAFGDVKITVLLEKNISDMLDLTESIFKAVFYTTTDSFSLEESFEKDLQKSLQSEIGIIDRIEKEFYQKRFDVLNLTESISKELESFKADIFSLEGTIEKIIDRYVKDFVDLRAFLTKDLEFSLADNFGTSDRIEKFVNLLTQDAFLFRDLLLDKGVGKKLQEVLFLEDKTEKQIKHLLSSLLSLIDQIQIVKKTSEAPLYRDLVMVLVRLRHLMAEIKNESVLVEEREKETTSSNRIVHLISDIRIREITCIPVHEEREDDPMLEFGPKQPWEEYYVAFNFVRVITPETEIESAVISVVDEEGTDVTSTLTDPTKIEIVDEKVFVWVRGGTEQVYKITCRITMDNGEKFEQDAELEVIEE